MDSTFIDPKDYKYFVKDPVSFSPARNKAIINETIKETEKYFTELENTLDDDVLNRIDILSQYGDYRFNRGQKNIKDYLGRKLYNSLIGEKILEKVRIADTANRLNGNRKNSILL